MNKEEYRDIPGYEGLYQVSNLGNVKSLERMSWNGKANHIHKCRILKPSPGSKGYLGVRLYKDVKGRTKQIHQLVAICFLGYKQDGSNRLSVDHKDSNKLNNELNNLQVVSHRLNSTKDIDKLKTSSKYTGVRWHKGSSKWVSQIQINRKNIHIGCFMDELEASRAYNKKILEINVR